ncbi:aminoacetone oxidase family FAD-binding enzyme [Patescibacteria group bacterium]|nr:aminoacetone oxidase family FAD-binding enzyme [Patescibacteria group bacterium]
MQTTCIAKIGIIGAGPSGIFLSLLIAGAPFEIHLFEQNGKIGEKLKLTGGGRMNITNKVFSVDEFSSENQNLLKKIFKSPWIQNREQIFEELGFKYFWEKNRAILESENAKEEVEKLKRKLEKQQNFSLHVNSRIVSAKQENGNYKLEIQSSDGAKEDFFDIVVIASGGMFQIGMNTSKNTVYKLATDLGHTVTNTNPSLSSLSIKNNPFANFAGISLHGTLTDLANKISITDDILFTHNGISGPATLDFSGIRVSNQTQICFISKISEEKFIKDFQQLRTGSHGLQKLLHNFIPKRLVEWHIKQISTNPEIKIADINKEKFKILIKNLFHYQFETIKETRYECAWTTRGGIPLNEINSATFESKISPNLYFAGEILDVNGLCGGYNISFAAISAKIISEALKKRWLNAKITA